MELSAAELLTLALAAASAVVAAFIAGAKIFYDIGIAQGVDRGKIERERLRQQIETLKASISELDETIRTLRTQLLEAQGLNRPTENVDLREVLDKILVEDERDIWRTFPAAKPPSHDERVSRAKVKVIAVANLKGGVGKTTVSTNLAAYLDRVLNKRVLFIDADYQGSSSDLLMKTAQLSHSTSKVDDWLQNISEPKTLFSTANAAGDKLKKTKFVTAFYSLSSIETRLMVKWLADRSLDASTPDLRYSLASILTSEFLNNFDAVVIDCPPRFSTATVEALCAATHLVVPTIPDASSLEATENFLNMAARLFAELNPALRLAAIVPMMTNGGALSTEEHARLENFKTEVTAFGGEPHVLKQNVLHSKQIADVAGSEIALMATNRPAIRAIFRDLGRELSERIGI